MTSFDFSLRLGFPQHERSHWPWFSGLTGGTGLQDHGQCGQFYFLFFSFCFYLLIDFIVLLFGMDLEVKGEETD